MCLSCIFDKDPLNGNPVNNSSVKWTDLNSSVLTEKDVERAVSLLDTISSYSYRTNQTEHQMKVT